MRIIILAATLLALSGCSKMSEDEMAAALEYAWANKTVDMASLSGTKLPGADPGALRGTASTAKAATEIARAYAGDIGGEVAQGAIDGVSGLAEDFGVEGATEVRGALGIATASDWTVRNLEVLAQRSSGDDYVASLRYDLTATIQGEPKTIARDITHETRFITTGDGWRVEAR